MSIDQLVEKLYAERKLHPQEFSAECKARRNQEWREFAEAKARENSWWRPLASYFFQVFAGFALLFLIAWAWPFLSPVVGVMLKVGGIALFLLVSVVSALFKVIAGLGFFGLIIVGLILWGLRRAYCEDPEVFKEKLQEYLRPATILFFIVLTLVVVGLDAFFTALLK